MKESYLILTEAGNQIGLGHYKRCCSIQHAILSNTISCEMIVYFKGELNLDLKSDLIFDWKIEKDLLIEKATKIKTVLIDSYLAITSFYEFCVSIFEKVIVIDDYNRIDYGPVDLLLNPNPYFDSFDYDNQKAKNIKGGKDYVIISPPFQNSISKNELSKGKTNKVIVFLGGSDYKNLLPVVVSILIDLGEKNIEVIAGNTEDQLKIEKKFKRINVLRNLSSEEMVTTFNSAKLIVSGCGQTLHELAILRKPTVGICIDIDQELNQKFYFNNGFLKRKLSYIKVGIIKKEINRALR
jgi:UDP-2,4-diacetamido-2,4,6-trideoxy-beta-L-altropyranose hydrolase